MSAPAADTATAGHQPPERAYYEETVKLPGFGPAPNRCRPHKPVGVCEHGHPILGRSSCETRGCPDHFRDWIEKGVIRMVARLAAYRYAQEGDGKRLVHAVASAPSDRRYSARAFWEARSEAYEAAEAAGVRGGAAVAHPYRTSDLGDDLFRTAVEEGEVEEDRGKWSFLRELAGDDWGEMREFIEPGPHVHILGAARDVDGDAAPEGWVVKNIDSLDRFHIHDLDSYRDMARRAYYVLTHGAHQEGRQTTTYFGSVHPQGFDPEEELTVTAWSKIQEMAEKAVKVKRGERGDDAVTAPPDDRGPEECPREECDGDVFDLVGFEERMTDGGDWKGHVLSQPNGRKRWLRLRGLLVFWFEGGDRPPPGVEVSQARYLEWLEDVGRRHTPEPTQSSLGGRQAVGTAPRY
jgi:hypothetical protein